MQQPPHNETLPRGNHVDYYLPVTSHKQMVCDAIDPVVLTHTACYSAFLHGQNLRDCTDQLTGYNMELMLTYTLHPQSIVSSDSYTPVPLCAIGMRKF